MHPALLLLDLVPELWWNQDRYLGPSIPLQFSRWLAESRDQRTGERLDWLEDPFRRREHGSGGYPDGQATP